MRTSSCVRIGLYGCNMYRTRDLMAGLESMAAGRYAVTACLDIDRDKAEHAAQLYGGRAFTKEDDFLSHDFDVAVISLPAFLHPQAFAATSKAGKDIYLEKPVCVDPEGRSLLIRTAKEYPVKCYVGLSYRYIAPFKRAAEILRHPDAGRVIGLHHHWLTPGYGPEQTLESNWRNRPQQSGGQLVFHCCHVLDWFRWVGGEVKSVTASAYTPDGVNLPHEERELTACLQFAAGGMAVFNLSQHSHQYTQRGTAHAQNVGLDYQWGASTFVKEYRTRSRAADVTHEWSLSNKPGDGSDKERTALQMKDFFDAYTEGRPMPCTLADGIRAYDIAASIRESYRTGKAVDVPSLDL